VRHSVLLLSALIALLGASCGESSSDAAPTADVDKPAASEPTLTERTLALEMFPCSRCHEAVDLPFPTGQLGPHRAMRSQHMEDLWRCDVCHALEYMDELRLVTGERITFNQSHRMCGQCHGDNYRDWKMGIHGKTVGSWGVGKRHRFTCTDCHDAHAPKPDSVVALPGPFKPRLLIPKHPTEEGAH
jgi:hypothetical protein